MKTVTSLQKVVLAAMCLGMLGFTAAYADQASSDAVAKARKDYENALKSNDTARINVAKIQLSVQMAKASSKGSTGQGNLQRTASSK